MIKYTINAQPHVIAMKLLVPLLVTKDISIQKNCANYSNLFLYGSVMGNHFQKLKCSKQHLLSVAKWFRQKCLKILLNNYERPEDRSAKAALVLPSKVTQPGSFESFQGVVWFCTLVAKANFISKAIKVSPATGNDPTASGRDFLLL